MPPAILFLFGLILHKLPHENSRLSSTYNSLVQRVTHTHTHLAASCQQPRGRIRKDTVRGQILRGHGSKCRTVVEEELVSLQVFLPSSTHTRNKRKEGRRHKDRSLAFASAGNPLPVLNPCSCLPPLISRSNFLDMTPLESSKQTRIASACRLRRYLNFA